ncbi:hypothetical protein O7626_30690 [Micromonospora sp. WMMD1102]|uniref:hypothetical protein n=1 Tax=Micromonospora sp. WMMD1102 TaxID=3016105 RepID=UPI002415857A|nr:hypothetical protein [Micromonospora sp. WMMD1102]MDG4790240.1 hypothetical protein [Micromonospora sp. WMMD1102]
MHPILGFIVGALIGALTASVVFVLVVSWPVLRVFWHWLPEILLGLGLVYGWQALMQAANLVVALLVLAVLVGVPAAVGPVRRRLVAWSWCLIVRHRLRMCFAAFVATNRNGVLPLVLLARPTPAGERVWIWLRPGLSLKDLEAEGQVHRLAVACWANEVRVMRASRRYAALIRVDITRREPLTDTVVSPLPGFIPTDVPANAPTSPGMPPVGLDLPDVPDEPVTGPDDNPRPRKPRNPTNNSTVADPSGFDPSDYA